MAITITPVSLEKSRSVTPGLPTFYLIVAFAFLGVCAAAALLVWFQHRAVRNELDELTRTIRELQVQKSELQGSAKKLNRLALQLSSLTELVNEHRRGSNALRIIGEKTHPEVQVTSVNIIYSTRTVDLSVQGRSLTSVAEQIYLLEENSLFERVTADNFRLLPNGEVEFHLVLTPRPQLFLLDEPDLTQFIAGSVFAQEE